MENGKDSNFLNKETRSKEKCKLETGTLEKHRTANTRRKREMQFAYCTHCNSKLILQRLKRL